MKVINAIEIAEKYNLYLKIVTAVRNFDSYNSFYNIYDENEEPVRRIAVLTKNKLLEEVYDVNSYEEITEAVIVQGDIWLKDYSLLQNPEKIDLSNLSVSEELVNEIL